MVGSSGSGKSTMARGLADRLGLARLELDAVFHQSGWQELPVDEFHERVRSFMRAAVDGWVIDGNYGSRGVQALVVEQADTAVWLDLDRWRVMAQLVPRSLGRVVLRKELWNGNLEQWHSLLSLDPETSVIAWSWTRQAQVRAAYERRVASDAWAHVEVIRLRHPRERNRFARDPSYRPPA